VGGKSFLKNLKGRGGESAESIPDKKRRERPVLDILFQEKKKVVEKRG